MERSTDPNNREYINRRGYLKSLGIAGLGVGSIQSVQARNDTTDIVITRNEEGPCEVRSVPKRWYEQLTHVREQVERLRDQLLENQSVVSVGITTSNSTIDGMSLQKIEILSRDRRHETLPSKINGVEVSVRRYGSFEFDGATKLEGGSEIWSYNDRDPPVYRPGSICTEVEKVETARIF